MAKTKTKVSVTDFINRNVVMQEVENMIDDDSSGSALLIASSLFPVFVAYVQAVLANEKALIQSGVDPVHGAIYDVVTSK